MSQIGANELNLITLGNLAVAICVDFCVFAKGAANDWGRDATWPMAKKQLQLLFCSIVTYHNQYMRVL